MSLLLHSPPTVDYQVSVCTFIEHTGQTPAMKQQGKQNFNNIFFAAVGDLCHIGASENWHILCYAISYAEPMTLKSMNEVTTP